MSPLRQPPALVAAAVVALAAPAPALAQSAGDDQYQDPFAGGAGQEQEDGSGSAGSRADDGAAAPGTAAPAPAAASAAADADPQPSGSAPSVPSGPAEPVAASGRLPYTGADGGEVMAVGAVLLAGGVALRVRLRDPR